MNNNDKNCNLLCPLPCLLQRLSITIEPLKTTPFAYLSMLNTHHNLSIRIYYEDTDAGGIVYYANYLKFTERARTEWLRELGINQQEFLQQNLGFVVRKVEMDNFASAKLDDLLTVQSSIVIIKRASLVFEQHIFNQQQQLLCTAKVRIACVDFNNNKPCAIPKFILGALKRDS